MCRAVPCRALPVPRSAMPLCSLRCRALWCCALRCCASQCSALPCSALPCSAGAVLCNVNSRYGAVPCSAVPCWVLPCCVSQGCAWLCRADAAPAYRVQPDAPGCIVLLRLVAAATLRADGLNSLQVLMALLGGAGQGGAAAWTGVTQQRVHGQCPLLHSFLLPFLQQGTLPDIVATLLTAILQVKHVKSQFDAMASTSNAFDSLCGPRCGSVPIIVIALLTMCMALQT